MSPATHSSPTSLVRRISRFAPLMIALALAACDGDPPITPDAGADPDDGSVADAHVPTPPTVIATSPADGASNVPRDTELQIAFSEPMDVTAGSIGAASDAGAIELGDPTWSEDRTTLTIAPISPLPAGATITVTIGSTFQDVDGEGLSPAYTFELSTLDDVAPTIVRATPAEGATDVPPDAATIELELSEPMRIAAGTARIEGPGAPLLGAVSWTDRVASWPVSGLLEASSYRVVLEGFEDSAGNALDASALGTEGSLDFTTGADERPPVVIASTPGEGQLDVDVGLISQIAIELSEPMDQSAGVVTLELGGTTTDLDARWDRDGTRLLVSVGGRLAAAAPHRIVLTGFADVAGNALDETAYLVDGALDFTTGTDSFVPFVAFTNPEEGATALAGGVLRMTVVFSEAMDPSVTTAPMTGDGRTVTLAGTWSSGDTVLTLDAPTLQAGHSYDVDLRGFRDAGGTAIDAAHPYLTDGISTFAFAAPTGERCGDALTEAEATSSAAGRVEWVLPSGAASVSDGSTPCDSNGHGPDVLVRYRKTTAAARDGGAALHVSVTAATSSHDLDVDILQGDCRPTGPVADTSRLRCFANGEGGWQSWLDVGPGDYFVWVARDGSALFSGATVTIEEVPAVREGESCSAPFDTTSAAPIYTAPTAVGQPHRWAIPAGYASSPDRGALPEGPAGALSCAPDTGRNHDVVVAFDKTSATSLVTVRLDVPSVSSAELGLEIARGCDPADAAYTSRECEVTRSRLTREWTLDGAAGPHSAWLVSHRRFPLPGGAVDDMPAATIEISEFEPQAGDSCATAIPITAGATNAVTATRPHRAQVPACLIGGGVTWFRYTPTQGLGVLRTNGATIGAVVDRASGGVLRCMSDDSTAGIPVFGVPGQEVCVALSSSATVSQITVTEVPYSGVRGVASGFDLDVPSGVSSPATLAWMSVLGDDLFRSSFGRIQTVSTSGGPLAQQSFTGLTTDGGGAVARPEGLYVLSSSALEDSGPRVFRVTDATGAFLAAPVPLETLPTGFMYPARAFDSLTWDGTQFLAATGQLSSSQMNPGCCTPSIFYAIPADGSTPVEIGSHNDIVDVNGIAADATYLYVYGRIATGLVGTTSTYDEAIYRLRRDQLTNPAQVPTVLFSGPDMSSDNGSIYVHDTTSAGVLYFRVYGGGSEVIAIVAPEADSPAWIGPLWRSSGTNQSGLAYDPTARTLWLLDTGPNPDRWVRLD